MTAKLMSLLELRTAVTLAIRGSFDPGAQASAVLTIVTQQLQATVERAQESAADPCRERCQRIHPHCQLRLTRSVPPDAQWHWAVTMPDGHPYDVSKGPMTFEHALADMNLRGLVALDAADTIWRRNAALSTQRGDASETGEANG